LLISIKKIYLIFLSLKKLITQSEDKFVSFGVINAYINNVKEALEKQDRVALSEAVSAPLKKENKYNRMYENASGYLRNVNKIFTFSNSRTIFEVILLIAEKKKNLKIFISESRPRNEGKITAKRLVLEKINVEYGTDAMMSEMICKADAVIIGADKILKDGSVINKTGSLNAAIIAAHYKKPFYVFAESSKKSKSFKKDYKDPGEILRVKNNNLKILNYYFEKIPAELITRIFTE
jgi:translation initiation factor 2B subunit (eIF-2B alpha/beta/delta family)